MALAEAPEPLGGAGRLPRRPASWSLGSVPPPALVLLGILSVQFGAGLAKHLFDRLPPSAVVLLRLLASAVVLGIVARKALRTVLRDHSRRELAVAAGLGLALATMNFSIYQSFSRIPLGVAVTIEFLGPLTVSVLGSRRPRDLVWVVLAAAGVLMLAKGGGDLDLVGVAFALLAGVCWAAYIVLTAATGKGFSGSTGLALASILAFALMLPVGVAAGGTALLSPELLLIGLGVGVLSSVIPYSLEMEALRRMPARVFGILMSLEPAVAALIGVLLLDEVLSGRQWVAVGCVMAACAGATLGDRRPPPEPAG
ncbi:EamA family transporter [Actinomadura hibisca]|uniref:EamA family transporter n=1 Tax=Actinomadura hibisca TaxID=68565 RepID=UPI000837441B|nr:EamA family transporter [Actinomadura hibisca]